MAGVNTSYVTEATYDIPDSNPWGAGGAPDRSVKPFGQNAEGGFYDDRDDMVGGTDNRYNDMNTDGEIAGANWGSYGDTAPAVNSASGLDGPGAAGGNVWSPATKFSGTLSQASLAGGENTGQFQP